MLWRDKNCVSSLFLDVCSLLDYFENNRSIFHPESYITDKVEYAMLFKKKLVTVVDIFTIIILMSFSAVSVGVSCYTLVAISLERYYAICQPFRSRRWQTLSHARRMLVGIWLLVLVVMSPIAAFHRLIVIRTGANACREIWPPILIQYRLV